MTRAEAEAVRHASRCTRALVAAFVAWGYGSGAAEPYLEAHAAWCRARSLPWGVPLALSRPWRDKRLGDAAFVAAHGLNVTLIRRPDLRQRAQRHARYEIQHWFAELRRAA